MSDQVAGLILHLEGLLRRSRAKGPVVSETVGEIRVAAEFFLTAKAKEIANGARSALVFTNPTGEIVVGLPESRAKFDSAKRAIERALSTLRRFSDRSLYAKRYRDKHERVLNQLHAELQAIAAASMSHDRGGAPSHAFVFFGTVAILWKHACGRFPPGSPVDGGVHDTLVKIVTYLSPAKRKPKGMSIETFQDAIAAAGREWKARERLGEGPPRPAAAYRLTRPKRRRASGKRNPG